MTPKQVDQLKRAALLLTAVADTLKNAPLSKVSLGEARDLIVDALDEEASNG